MLEEKVRLFQRIWSQWDPIEREAYLSRFSLQYTHHSTAIEGNTLTYAETVVLLNDGIVPSGGKTYREVNEIVGHDLAYKKLLEFAGERREITEDVICQFNRLCMFPAQYAGHYRNCNAYITGSQVPVTKPMFIRVEIRAFLEELKTIRFASPLERAAYVHARFVCIHPFNDGNGRTSRLLMNLSLQNDGWPMICIKKEDRASYIEALEDYAVTRRTDSFCAFLGQVLERQLDEVICVSADPERPESAEHH